MSLVLAVDLGGSGLKAGLFDPEGRLLASARQALAFHEAAGGLSEADPGVWWQALASAAEAIAALHPLDGVAMVAVCGFTRTQVFLDRAGAVIRPAPSFRDSRAAGVAATLREQTGEAALNAFHPLARLAWLRTTEPEAWARLHRVVEPKDYLTFRLTGQIRSDSVSMRWLDEAWSGPDPLALRAGLDRQTLPGLGQPLEVAGQVRPGLPGALGALAGAGVMLGSNDTWMAVAGMDGLVPGRAYCVSGSSEVLGLLSRTPGRAEGLVTINWGRFDGADLWHLGGPGLNGANVLDWAEGVLAPAGPAAEAQAAIGQAAGGQAAAGQGGAAAVPAQADAADPGPALLFLPFLQGERVPYWDADLRAAVLGADAQTSAADLRRAAMEGIAHLNRVVLERAEAAAGHGAEAIRIGGGGARSDTWNQIRADVTGRTILASPVDEMGLAGCQAAARVALGQAADLSEAARAVLPPFRRFEPDPATRARHDALHDLFAEAQVATAPILRRLAALSRS